MIVAGIILFCLAIAFNVVRNHLMILHKGRVNHAEELIVKGISCLPAIVCFSLNSNFVFILALSVSSFMIASYFYTFFEGILGLIISNDFWYRGTATGKDQANTDKVVKDMPQWLFITIKIVLILLSTYIYYLGTTK